jgi:hypothetical protein
MINKNFVRFGLGMTLAGLVACGSDSGGNKIDGGTNNPDGGGGDVTLSGTVRNLQDQTELEGVTVQRHPAAGASTTSSATGTFSLTTVSGQQLVSYSKAGSWTSLIAYDVPATGLTGVTAFVASDTTIGLIGTLLGATVDETKGVLLLNFPTPKAGVQATISSTPDGSFISDSNNIPAEGDTTEADSIALAHYGIAPGTITITLSDAGCTLDPDMASVPIIARTITTIDVVCQ